MRRIEIILTVASALFIACSSLVSGCEDGNGRSTKTEELGENATATPQAVVGPLLVYTKEVRETSTADRLWPTLAVVTYDVGARRELSSFEVGGFPEYPAQAAVAGRTIVVSFERRIDAFNLDGSDERTLVDAGADGYAGNIVPALDGGRVAVGVFTPARNTVVVLEVETGARVAELHPPDGLGAPVGWQGAGEGIILYPGQGSSRFAIQRLDGSSRIYETGGSTIVSPGGQFAATLTGVGDEADIECVTAKPELVVRDLSRDAVVATISADRANVGVNEWSPDGSELIYHTQAYNADPENPGCVIPDELSLRWYRLRLPAGVSEPALGLFEVLRAWHGDRYVEYRCQGQPTTSGPYCFDDVSHTALPVDLYVGDVLVGSGKVARVLGFVK